jgi:hypothetical protein
MKRLPLAVAALVFGFSALAELATIQLMYGSLEPWIHHPKRSVVLATVLAINLFNAVIAALLAVAAQKSTLLRKQTEESKREMSKYLNHHVRNALCSLQYATHRTRDPQAIQMCDQAITRIVEALAASEARAVRL